MDEPKSGGKVAPQKFHPAMNSGGEAKTSLEFSQGKSPRGYDLIIVSSDSEFSSGTLFEHVLGALQYKETLRQIINGKGFRVAVGYLSSKKSFSLARVVSISDSTSVSNSQTLKYNLINLLEEIKYPSRELTSVLGNQVNRIWIPLLGTGSARLTNAESAQIIQEALQVTLLQENYDGPITELTIDAPTSLNDTELTTVRKVFMLSLIHI